MENSAASRTGAAKARSVCFENGRNQTGGGFRGAANREGSSERFAAPCVQT
jgi:hypothetical protein